MAEAMSRSSSMADEEEEVFEITDFTTVSDWEKFVAQISEAISDWQLTCIEHIRPLKKNELTMGSWEQFSKEIRFSNAIFMLTLYRLKQSGGEDVYFEESENTVEDELHLPAYMDDMMSTGNDFPPRAHCLVRWYGFRSFLVLSLITSGKNVADGLTSESKCNLLLSSACIVLSETGCEVPIFIQIQQNWRKMFTGRCVGTGMQTEFEMVHLKKCPPQYQHLSGLLHVFRSKIGRTISPVQVSARFSYTLSNWGDSGVWPPEQIDSDFAAQTLDKFLFGCLEDPIGDLQLSAVWPSITEDLIIENDVYSDFNPLIAPVWTIKLVYTDNPECLLSSYVKEMIKLRNCTDTFGALIKTARNTQGQQDIGLALSKLTDTSHKVKKMVPLMPELTSGISKIVPRPIWANRIKSASYIAVGPISQRMMELMMEFLLPEDGQDIGDKKTENPKDLSEKGFVAHELEHQIKSAPRNSVTYRLATCLTVANYCHGGISAIAQVWHEFVQEMRYRFENGIPISGMTSGNPDLRCCLLHQKIQMLNCCIQHKINREKGQNKLEKIPKEDLQESDNSTIPLDSQTSIGDIKSHSEKRQHEAKVSKEVGLSSVDGGKVDDNYSESTDGNRDSLDKEGKDSSILIEHAMGGREAEIQSRVGLTAKCNKKQPKVALVVGAQNIDFVKTLPGKNMEAAALRNESSTSLGSQSPPGSAGWQEEMSSIDDEFFDCEDGDEAEQLLQADIGDYTALDSHGQDDDSDVKLGANEDNSVNMEVGIGISHVKVNDKDNSESVDKGVTSLVKNAIKEVDDKEVADGDDMETVTACDSSIDVSTDPTAEPVGRLQLFGTAKLLNFDVPLYIPVTQEPAPLTEDFLEEQTKIFSSLGDSAEGARLRRKMQSASLLSDMESFKAANPGCVLADFVRWYSPRDYEETGKTGSLSDRMRIPGNLWQTMWENAKSVPARRQKRLFDDTKEGEKVLHYFSSLQPKDLVILLLPMCFHEAIRILQGKSDANLTSVPTLCKQILTQSCKFFQGNYGDKFAQMDDIFQKILFTETLVERAMSLRHKFSKVGDSDAFVRRLIENPEVVLVGAANGDVGRVVKQYFFDQGNAALHQYSTEDESPKKVSSLPPPRGREYILRSTAPRPSAQSRPLPHRMYTVLMKNEFRLAGAFSNDTVFF